MMNLLNLPSVLPSVLQDGGAKSKTISKTDKLNIKSLKDKTNDDDKHAEDDDVEDKDDDEDKDDVEDKDEDDDEDKDDVEDKDEDDDDEDEDEDEDEDKDEEDDDEDDDEDDEDDDKDDDKDAEEDKDDDEEDTDDDEEDTDDEEDKDDNIMDDMMVNEHEVNTDSDESDDEEELERKTNDLFISAVTSTNKLNSSNAEHKFYYPYLTKYEKNRVVSIRAKQLNCRAVPMIDISQIPKSIKITSINIALEELKQKKLPLMIKRIYSPTDYQIYKLSELVDMNDY
jgi:DNA-directed RNA polymerase subunit K/omega